MSYQDLHQQQLLTYFVAALCKNKACSNPDPSPYRLAHVPPIALGDFIQRLHQYFACSSSCLVVAAVYLSRAHKLRPDMFDASSAHKLVLSALVLAAKFTEDVVCVQAHYARCGGIEVYEMNELESTFANILSFSFFVSKEEFDNAHRALCSLASPDAMLKATHFTTTINCVSASPPAPKAVQPIDVQQTQHCQPMIY